MVMPKPSTNRFVVRFCFGAIVVASLARSVMALEIVPATLQDILRAMGPDAKGLALSQDALPDLFTLTASRIEESPKHFVVEQPYQSGRWQGGKAVIEYARDLSYTLVSVYDKEGHRQRIYSVGTNFTEHIASQTETPAATPVNAHTENVPQEAPAPPPARPSPLVAASAPPKSSASEKDLPN